MIYIIFLFCVIVVVVVRFLNQTERHKDVKIKRHGGQKRQTKQRQKEEEATKIKTQRVKKPHLAPAESKLRAARVERRAAGDKINFPRSIRSGSTASWKLTFCDLRLVSKYEEVAVRGKKGDFLAACQRLFGGAHSQELT